MITISVKSKGILSMFFLSISFFMMIETVHINALGDYVLEFIGLRPWTRDYTGIHLTVYYFGIFTILGIFFVDKYVKKGLGIKKGNILLFFIALLTIFTLATNFAVENIKERSEGLLSIGFNSKVSSLSYQYDEGDFTKFNVELEMTNYSNKSREFYLTIENPFSEKENIDLIEIYNKDGKRALFSIGGNETLLLDIDLNHYSFKGGNLMVGSGGSGAGTIEHIILTDTKGNKVRLVNNNFFGIMIEK